MRMLPLVIALAVALAGAPAQAQQSPPPIRIDDTMAPLAAPLPDAARLARFDAFVASVQKQFDVPGVAIGRSRMRLKSVKPLLPPKPVSLRKNSSIAAKVSAWVMIEKYTPLMRERNAK